MGGGSLRRGRRVHEDARRQRRRWREGLRGIFLGGGDAVEDIQREHSQLRRTVYVLGRRNQNRPPRPPHHHRRRRLLHRSVSKFLQTIRLPPLPKSAPTHDAVLQSHTHLRRRCRSQLDRLLLLLLPNRRRHTRRVLHVHHPHHQHVRQTWSGGDLWQGFAPFPKVQQLKVHLASALLRRRRRRRRRRRYCRYCWWCGLLQ